MAEQPQRVALITGGTGEVGKQLINQMVSGEGVPLFSQVFLLQRRHLDDKDSIDQLAAKHNIKVSPILRKDLFAALTSPEEMDALVKEHPELATVTHGFCALGTGYKNDEGKNVTPEEEKKVDRDLVIAFAEFCKTRLPKCHDFGLVTAIFSDSKSKDSYYQTKGEAEEGVIKVGFKHLYIYRPGQLICDRKKEWRPFEWMAMKAAPLADVFFPGKYSISTADLAKCILDMVASGDGAPNENAVTIFENSDMVGRLKELKRASVVSSSVPKTLEN